MPGQKIGEAAARVLVDRILVRVVFEELELGNVCRIELVTFRIVLKSKLRKGQGVELVIKLFWANVRSSGLDAWRQRQDKQALIWICSIDEKIVICSCSEPERRDELETI